MKTQRNVDGGKRVLVGWHSCAARAIFLLASVCVAVLPAMSQDQKDSDTTKSGSIGFIASKDASAKEIGLPLYPGSQRHKDKSDDDSAVQLGLWGGSYGFKLAVIKMESNDPPEKVAAFYRKALGKYGKVLNCTDPSNTSAHVDKDSSSHELTCDSDHAEEGETVLKSGTKDKQHIASIKANGTGSTFNLVFLQASAPSNDK